MSDNLKPEDEFIAFLEVHPEFYPLSQSTFYIDFLKTMSTQAKTIGQFSQLFPKIEQKDLELIVFSLQKLKLISRAVVGEQKFYYISHIGKEFLEKYVKAKESLA